MPSKSRSPFWNRLVSQKLIGIRVVTDFPSRVNVRDPCGTQVPSANSHSCPLSKLLLGQAIGPVVPSVSGLWHRKVLRLHEPSPTLSLPSLLPIQVSKVLGSFRPAAKVGLWWVRDAHTSLCPISCCISTPPSRAAHGTWFGTAAVAYSAWKVCGEPAQVLTLVFMK